MNKKLSKEYYQREYLRLIQFYEEKVFNQQSIYL